MSARILAVFLIAISAATAGPNRGATRNHGYPNMPEKFQWAAQIDRAITYHYCGRLLLNSPDSDFLNPKVLFSDYVAEDVIAGEKFALDEMVRSDVMTQEQADAYLKGTIEIEPERLSYVAVSYYRVRPSFFIGTEGQPWEAVYRPPSRVSFLRMVSGHDAAGAAKPLPWMTEPQLAEFVPLVDRAQSGRRYVFEWGRAADVDRQGMIRENVALMSYVTARDVVLAGGKISDAEIQIHSTTKLNTENYKRNYRFQLLAEKGLDAILAKPLAELLEVFKPWHFFPTLAKIMNLRNATPDSAISIHERIKQFRLSGFDLKKESGKLGGVVWFSDHSKLARRAEKKLLKELVDLGAKETEAAQLFAEARADRNDEPLSDKPYVLVVANETSLLPSKWLPAAAEKAASVFSKSGLKGALFIVEADTAEARKNLKKAGFWKQDETHYAIDAESFLAFREKETEVKLERGIYWSTHVRNNL